MAAIVALVGAPLAGLAGMLLDVDKFLVSPSAPIVAYAANALLLAVIPLLMLGAFLLDGLEDDYRRVRAQHDAEPKRPAIRLVHSASGH